MLFQNDKQAGARAMPLLSLSFYLVCLSFIFLSGDTVASVCMSVRGLSLPGVKSGMRLLFGQCKGCCADVLTQRQECYIAVFAHARSAACCVWPVPRVLWLPRFVVARTPCCMTIFFSRIKFESQLLPHLTFWRRYVAVATSRPLRTSPVQT